MSFQRKQSNSFVRLTLCLTHCSADQKFHHAVKLDILRQLWIFMHGLEKLTDNTGHRRSLAFGQGDTIAYLVQ